MILVDANNWVWRAHHAGDRGGQRLTSEGRPTAVLHVGLSMLAALPDLIPPAPLMFMWDGGLSWRKNVMAEYKGNREVSEERKLVYQQIDIFKEVLTAIGIRQVEVLTMEADDLAGIFTELLAAKKTPVTLISGDKDWYQLLRPGVKQLKGWKGKKVDWWTAERVLQQHKVSVTDWPKYLALVGDSSDNIPKALKHGLGPVHALKVLRGQAKLTAEEQVAYERNLLVTTILRKLDTHLLKSGMTYVKRSAAGWHKLGAVLQEYDLFQLWGERKRLWTVGGWK